MVQQSIDYQWTLIICALYNKKIVLILNNVIVYINK